MENIYSLEIGRQKCVFLIDATRYMSKIIGNVHYTQKVTFFPL